MKNKIFFAVLIFVSYTSAFSQSVSLQTNVEKNKKTIKYLEEDKMKNEIFQEELLIEVMDLSNVEAKVEDRLTTFISHSEFFTFYGTCNRLNIVMIKVDKSFFKNYNDVKAKIDDNQISKGIRFVSGTFSDIDSLCN